tara:strand:+ start:113 stop:1006 length:894 start_codon:yes stop_codon:yes gene_type:complete
MGYLGTPIDTNNTFQSLQGKRFSGNGSTTAFTLDIAPASTLDIEVFVENVRQDPNSAYSLSGTTLTFSAAPDAGTNNIYVVHQAKAVATISAGAGTVNAASFSNDVISGHDALAATPADTDEFLVSDAGTIKRIDYSYLKDNPITVARTYRLTTNLSISADTVTTITSNWESVDTDGGGSIGTAMTESSGIFSYPSTGIYFIKFVAQIHSPSQGATYAGGAIQTTADNSTYNNAAVNQSSIYHSNGYGQGVMSFIHDVTNTTNDKVRFQAECEFAADAVGNTGQNTTYVSFIRLGDT